MPASYGKLPLKPFGFVMQIPIFRKVQINDIRDIFLILVSLELN